MSTADLSSLPHGVPFPGPWLLLAVPASTGQAVALPAAPFPKGYLQLPKTTHFGGGPSTWFWRRPPRGPGEPALPDQSDAPCTLPPAGTRFACRRASVKSGVSVLPRGTESARREPWPDAEPPYAFCGTQGRHDLGPGNRHCVRSLNEPPKCSAPVAPGEPPGGPPDLRCSSPL